MTQLFSVLRDRIRTDLWPVPVAMLLLGVLLFMAALEVDRTLPDSVDLRGPWMHSGSGDDARNLFSTLLTAIITMASVVLSMTLVALSLAANQFGSRLVRVHMSDIRTKLAIGLFTLTTVSYLLGLSLLEQDMTPAEVPHFMMTFGSLLALSCVLALLYFLHVVARSMIADEVIRRVGRELEVSIRALPPVRAYREPAADEVLPADFEQGSAVLRASAEGYVEAIDYDSLVAAAAAHDVVVRLDFRPGVYMAQGGWLGAVYPATRAGEEIGRELSKCVLIGARRTPTQDLEFSLRHLTDVALRALSPGINDANTAIVVIDRLRGALSALMIKALPTAVHRDVQGAVRVVGRYNSYRGLLDSALHQIRQSAGPQPAVIITLLMALGRIAEHVTLPEQKDALLHHLHLVAAAGLRHVEEPLDRADIERTMAASREKLERCMTGR